MSLQNQQMVRTECLTYSLRIELAAIYIRNVESDSEDIYMTITDMIY